MSRRMMAMGMACLLLPLAACTSDNQQGAAGGQQIQLTTTQDSLGYAFGMNIGESIKPLLADVNIDAMVQGIRDFLAEGNTTITQEQAGELMAAYSMRRRASDQRERNEQGAKNLEAGNAFLAENARRPEVKSTASGLQYEVLREAEGPKPKETDQVRVHYQGTLVDGTVFDSSIERGEPVTFPLNRVIPGWTEGLQLMSVGSKYKFYIPGDLAYGVQGGPPGSQIGPNQVLIFEVELLSIES